MVSRKVSVVMPVYNREAFVGRAIESILAQTMTDYELIIVDDASTDKTASVLMRYAQQDNRIRLLLLPSNGGQGLARAIGTDAASGDYLAVMDSDDVALPERLATQVAFMEANPAVTLSGSHVIKVTANGHQSRPKLPQNDAAIKARLILVDSCIVHPTVIMRLDFLREHNLNYSAERRGDDDYEFFNRMMAAGARFANMPEVLLAYHRHGGNVSTSFPRLEQDKLPLRQFLLRCYYPDLTGREVATLAGIVSNAPELSLKQAYAGVLAAEKAATMLHSQYGEDHQTLNHLLKYFVDRVMAALKKAAH